ncbi:MAG TPA: hypothetical protein VMC83_35045 [Streptosporangiaceae bacterium]|nr:hypothetical protein [Streptosporangiaceae bacterium]
MARSDMSGSGYTVRQAAALLGLTEDAIRKRVLAGRLDGHVDEGSFVVSADAVESARRDHLERINARDARAGATTDGAQQELKHLRETVERLQEELVRTRAALQSMVQAESAINDGLRAHLDVIQQLTLPGSVRSLMDTSGT